MEDFFNLHERYLRDKIFEFFLHSSCFLGPVHHISFENMNFLKKVQNLNTPTPQSRYLGAGPEARIYGNGHFSTMVNWPSS